MHELKSVLLVDRDRAWSDFCSRYLSELNFNVICAHSIERGVDKITDPEISMVIVDYGLRGVDGINQISSAREPCRLAGPRPSYILTTAVSTLDIAIAAIRASVVDLLIKPFTVHELGVTLNRVRAMHVDQAHERAANDKLLALTEVFRRLGDVVEEWTGNEGAKGDLAQRKNISPDAAMVRKLIRAEATRAVAIGGKTVGDPTWNILFDLLLASLENRQIAISSACIVAGMPTTTALRLITRMVDDNVLIRVPDGKDGRRHFLAIEPTVEVALKRYIRDLANL
ncbi:response regulator [Sandarakinorhabdus sp.]|uniref:response regulator n=1 Tax=Sandarakinorhabdus sp. TaxID=1916663 RepID=UPI003563CFAE